MKRTATIALLAALPLSLTACLGGEDEQPEDQPSVSQTDGGDDQQDDDQQDDQQDDDSDDDQQDDGGSDDDQDD